MLYLKNIFVKHFYILVVLFVNIQVLPQQVKLTSYPIIFVHGINAGNDTWNTTVDFLGGEAKIFDVCLNHDHDIHKSLVSSDVYPVGWRDGLINIPSPTHLYVINFNNELFPGNDHSEDILSNQAAILKQGKALQMMIQEVLRIDSTFDKVILVGHSMGGLAIREYLQRTNNNSPNSKHRWWINPDDTINGHKVARVVTIGTPHFGSNAAIDPTPLPTVDNNSLEKNISPNVVKEKLSLIPNSLSEAARDLRYSYSSFPNCPLLTPKGIYLFGGGEDCLFDGSFNENTYYNRDINCNGDESDVVVGLNSYGSQTYNHNMLLPTNIKYTWIESDANYGECATCLVAHIPNNVPGDGAVLLSNQFIPQEKFGIYSDTLLTNRQHTPLWGNPGETEDYYSIIRGMDEPDLPSLAYEIGCNKSIKGLITYQQNYWDLDIDLYKIVVPEKAYLSINITGSSSSCIKHLDLLNNNSDLLDSISISSFSTNITRNLSSGTYYIRVIGMANANSYMFPYTLITSLSKLKISNPLGGESYPVGSTVNIQWTSTNIDNVKIDYTFDGGLNPVWNPVVDSYLASAQSYLWMLPNTPSSNCKVRISDAANSKIFDISDSVFSILFDNSSTITYEGKVYHTVQIGNQVWLKENLDVGTMISGSQDATDNGIIEKYCYADSPANCITYGGLYQWDEAMRYVTNVGAQGICPTGWHIPAFSEIQILLASVNYDPKALKAIGQGNGTNTSGFSFLLAGVCTGYSRDNYFTSLHSLGEIFSSNFDFLQLSDNGSINFGRISDGTSIMPLSMSLRCLKDDNTSITLTSPIGGESWSVNSVHKIEWSFNNIANIKIEYSTNGGNNWNLITSSTPASLGFCSWSITNATTAQCKIKLSDVLDSSRYSTSGNFIINNLLQISDSRIFFTGYAANGIQTIYSINANGTDLKRLFNDEIYRYWAVVSKNGQKIAYAKRSPAGPIADYVCIANIDGSNEQILPIATAPTLDPDGIHIEGISWHPSGNKLIIAYASNRIQDGNRDGDIFEYDIQNNVLTNLTNTWDNIEFYPHYTPDGNKIVYQYMWTGWFAWYQNIYIMKADGTEKTALTSEQGFNNNQTCWAWSSNSNAQYPYVSPNGNNIIYYRECDFYDGIYKMNIDGTNNVKMDIHPGDDFTSFPIYDPKGSYIAFQRLNNIVISDSDGFVLSEIPIVGITSCFLTAWSAVSGVLPVELVNFSGKQTNGNVLLTWETKTEVQNSGFDVERKTAIDKQFVKIGFIKGSGNSNAPKQYSYSDNSSQGGKVAYRLGQINSNGLVTYSNEIEVNIIPSEYILYQNYPNPFNPSTVIKYAAPFESSVNIKFYNSLGQCVREVNEGNKQPGYYELNFNSSGLASGVYFYAIKAVSTEGKNNFSSVKKMIIMK
jgi:uncharacterized protein (TIGR02145 family)